MDAELNANVHVEKEMETDELRVGWMGRLNGALETEKAAVIANYERK